MNNETNFRNWMINTFEKEDLESIANDGCANGQPHLTYYSDTCALYDKYENDIWEILEEEANCCDTKNVLDFISTLNGAKDVSDNDQFKNLLVWFMAEHTAQDILDKRDYKDEN